MADLERELFEAIMSLSLCLSSRPKMRGRFNSLPFASGWRALYRRGVRLDINRYAGQLLYPTRNYIAFPLSTISRPENNKTRRS